MKRTAATVQATRLLFLFVAALTFVQQLPMLIVSNWSLFDLRIYRAATHLVVHGGADHLYSAVFNGGWVYTYPPFSIAMFAPLDPLPEPVATALTTAGSAAALARIGWLAGREMVDGWLADHGVSASRTVTQAASYLLASGVVLVAVMSDPVKGTFGFGQVNLVLAWLVTEDYLGFGGGRSGVAGLRGALTGIAGGIKLTPALSWVPRVLARQWRPALAGLAAGLATVLLSALVLPRQTWNFFTGIVWNADRPGDVWTEWNQSLTGMTHRLFPAPAAATAPTVALVAVSLVCGMYAATVLLRRGDRLGCVLVSALTTALVSPISWYHHLVLLPVLIFWTVARGSHWSLPWRVALQAQTLLLAIWVVPGLYQNVPRGDGAELHHTLGQLLVSEAVPALGLTTVVSLAFALLLGREGTDRREER